MIKTICKMEMKIKTIKHAVRSSWHGMIKITESKHIIIKKCKNVKM